MKAGLGNKKQAAKARKAQHNKQKLKATGVNVIDEAELLAQQATKEKVERDRELNRQKQQQANDKAIQAQIRQLIELNSIDERGEVEFRFTDGSTIKTVMLQDEHRKLLVNGRLVVVRFDEDYKIVPRPVADKIAERDSSLLVLQNEKTEDESVDDEYADFKVPDDLMW